MSHRDSSKLKSDVVGRCTYLCRSAIGRCYRKKYTWNVDLRSELTEGSRILQLKPPISTAMEEVAFADCLLRSTDVNKFSVTCFAN